MKSRRLTVALAGGETVAFDNAIGVALDYQHSHPDTLVVVTADHAHTSQIVSEDAEGDGLPTGYSTNLLTKDGQTLSLTYGTAGFGGPGAAPVAEIPSQQHTGAVVPGVGQGPRLASGARHQRPYRPVLHAGRLTQRSLGAAAHPGAAARTTAYRRLGSLHRPFGQAPSRGRRRRVRRRNSALHSVLRRHAGHRRRAARGARAARGSRARPRGRDRRAVGGGPRGSAGGPRHGPRRRHRDAR